MRDAKDKRIKELEDALRPFANAYTRMRSYCEEPTNDSPLYAGYGDYGYELIDGEEGPPLTVDHLQRASILITGN